MNLRKILTDWLIFRKDTTTRRLNFRKEIIEKRIHILHGLEICHLNIDEIIKIIRENDEPKPILMERFNLTDVQAEAILELKLRYIAKLEREKNTC